MAVEIQGDHGLSSGRVAKQGGRVSPGWGHFALEAVVEEPDHVALTFVCLAHQDADSVDGKYAERLYTVSSKGKDPKPLFERLMFFALKLGLVTEAQIDSGERLEIEFADAAGRQVVLHLKEETYKDKTTGEDKKASRCDYKGIYRVSDDEVAAKKVPLDHEALAMGGITLAATPAEAAPKNGTTKPAANSGQARTAQPVVAGTKPIDDLGDL
jgi:hypothetical protein